MSGNYNNSSSGANLTPYSGVIFRGVILTPKYGDLKRAIKKAVTFKKGKCPK